MKPGQPVISVVLCTYNRARILGEALEGLLEQSMDHTHYEVIVVNNASTDRTAHVVSDFQRAHPTLNLVSVFEKKQGLGHARNTGWQHAKGTYVAFLDDDCRAPRPWLQLVLDCFWSVRPEPWSVGGPIFPTYHAPRPNWFKDEYEQWTWGQDARFLRRGESFFGGNMAFRKDLIGQYGGFDVGVGMNGLEVSAGEETGLFQRMWQRAGAGCAFYYCPGAVMYHRISASRMTWVYLVKRAFAEGQASYRLAAPHTPIERLTGLLRGLSACLWHGGRILLRARPDPSWHNWVVETGRVLGFHVGRMAGYMGLTIRVNVQTRREPLEQ